MEKNVFERGDAAIKRYAIKGHVFFICYLKHCLCEYSVYVELIDFVFLRLLYYMFYPYVYE